MRRLQLFGLGATFLLWGCASVLPSRFGDYRLVDWDFIQSVGGIAIGDPSYDMATDSYRLPVYVDFTGHQKITIEPTLTDSGNFCHHINFSFSTSTPLLPGGEIHFMAWADSEEVMPPQGCNMLIIPARALSPITGFRGTYRIRYRDSRFQLNGHLIGELTL